jgi:undecaprenyl-diphosphatase
MDFDILQATLLALLQGFTEFLPISSSAHLILPAALLGWDDQGLAFDVAVHLGTLLAVILYFRKDLCEIAAALLVHVFKGRRSQASALGWHLLIATIPVLVAGFMLKDFVDDYLRSVIVITAATLVFGILLWLADRHSDNSRDLTQLDWKISLLIGLAQMLALVPGTSRSGVTMTMALFCNMDREAASRFSFLLSIPVIGGAAVLQLLDLLAAPSVNWSELLYALTLAALTEFTCIHFFLKVIAAIGFLPFVIYRMVLGAALLLFLLL